MMMMMEVEDPGDGVDDADSLITVPTGFLGSDSDGLGFHITRHLSRQTREAGGESPAATLITGGKIHPQAGSGTMAITVPSDAQVEAGEKISTLTLVYKSATVLMMSHWQLM